MLPGEEIYTGAPVRRAYWASRPQSLGKRHHRAHAHGDSHRKAHFANRDHVPIQPKIRSPDGKLPVFFTCIKIARPKLKNCPQRVAMAAPRIPMAGKPK